MSKSKSSEDITVSNSENDKQNIDYESKSLDCKSILMIIIAWIIPLIFIIGNAFIWSPEKDTSLLGLDMGNAVALLSTAAAITAMLYSNKNNENRLNKQLQFQTNQFLTQIKENKDNLREQLIFDNKIAILLELYDILKKNQMGISVPTNFTCEITVEYRSKIFLKLHKINNNSIKLFFLPEKIRLKIKDYINCIGDGDEPYLHKTTSLNARINTLKDVYCTDECEKILNDLWELVEKYLEMEIPRWQDEV
nr:hypothetical protein [Methanobrevibacter arboriphilus]